MVQACVGQQVCRELDDVDTPQALHYKIKEGVCLFTGVKSWWGRHGGLMVLGGRCGGGGADDSCTGAAFDAAGHCIALHC